MFKIIKNHKIIIPEGLATNKILKIKEKQYKHLKLGKLQILQLLDILGIF